jgi:hypothetical protein
MIKELSDALRRLVYSLSVKPIATMVAIFLISISYVAIKSYDTLEKMVVTPDEEAVRFREQLESAKLVNESLEKLRASLGAHSVVIKQFHNGRHDLTGIPFTEATATYHTESYDTIGTEAVSTMNTSLRRIWTIIDKPTCIVLNGPVDSSTRKYFMVYELNRVVECPLTNLLNYPIGKITVGFSADNTTSDEVAVTKTAAIAKRVTGYLNNGY